MESRLRFLPAPCVIGVIYCLTGVALSDGDQANDDRKNPIVGVVSAVLTRSDVSGESAVEVTFDGAVKLPENCSSHAFGANKVPIITSKWITPALEDLDGDGRLDLVVVEGSGIYAHHNVGDNGTLQFDGNGELIATMEVDHPSATAILFGDADGDGDRDIICGEWIDGNVLFFPMKDLPYEEGQIREFDTQKFLEFQQPGGGRTKIASAMEDVPGDPDIAMASPVLLDFDGDGGPPDLLLADNLHSTKFPIFWIYRYLGSDPNNGLAPYYAAPVTLENNGTQIQIPETARAAVPTLVEFDRFPGADLVVSLESGHIYVSKGTWTPGAPAQFGAFQQLTRPAGQLIDVGKDVGARPIDIDGDGDLELLVSSLTESGPSRRLIRVLRALGSDSFASLETHGVILGTASAPVQYSPSKGVYHFELADLNGDGDPDIIEGLPSGEIMISLSSDSGDSYNPDFTSPVFCRTASGEVFSFANFDELAPPRPVVYDSDLDGFPEGFIVATGDSLSYLKFLNWDEYGCILLDDPVPIPVPGAVDVEEATYVSVTIGDFSPGIGGDSPDGMILIKESGFSTGGAGGTKGREIYWLPLILPQIPGDLPVLGESGIELLHEDNDFTQPPSSPSLWDFDGDGDLDLITNDASAFRWWENDAASLTPRGIAVEPSGAKVYRNLSNSFQVFSGKGEPLPLVMATSKRSSDPVSPALTRIYQLEGIDANLDLLLERHPLNETVQVKQTLASKVEQLSPQRIRMSVAVDLVDGDEIIVNSVFVGEQEIFFRSFPMSGDDADGDGLPGWWELANGTDPFAFDTWDPGADYDRDGVYNFEEIEAGTDVFDPDSSIAIYLSPDGDDVNSDGTFSSPCKTLSRAGVIRTLRYSAGEPSDLVVAKDGVYTGSGNTFLSLPAPSRIYTLRSINGPELTVFDGLKVSGMRNEPAPEYFGYLAIEGIKIRNAPGTAVEFENGEFGARNCIFETNSGDYGGAIGCHWGGLSLESCRFLENSASLGGAIYFSGDDNPFIRNCYFIDNEASEKGGAIYCDLSDELDFVNCTLVGNEAGDDGGAIYIKGYGWQNVYSVNSIIWGNEVPQIGVEGGAQFDASYSDIEQAAGIYPGTGNINSDPVFVADPNVSGQTYLLSGISPCIDAGKANLNYPSLNRDYDGQPRWDHPLVAGVSAVDIGADEYRFDRDGDGLADYWEEANGLDRFDGGFFNPSQEGRDGDLDGDGIVNSLDATPDDDTTSTISITIDTPADGVVITE